MIINFHAFLFYLVIQDIGGEGVGVKPVIPPTYL